MKNYNFNIRGIRWLLISIGLMLTIQVLPQITIDQNDMPSAGDTIRRSTALNLELYDFELTGENYLWDFSDLNSISQTVDTFVRVTETPLFYWPFFLLSSNLASPLLTDSPFPELPLSDVYTFYNNSASNYQDVGFAATLLQIPLPFNFDEGDVLYEFPMNYGNVDSSESGFQLGLEGIGFVTVERKRVNTVDGWGTLITPYGTFEVLRLKSEVSEYDSIYIDSVSIGVPIEREYIEYKWMGKNQKLPLLQATDDLLSLIVTYIDSVPSIPTGTAEIQNVKVDLHCYPNPTSGEINIDHNYSGKEALMLNVYTTSGELVFQSEKTSSMASSFRLDLNAMDLPKGIYIVELSGNSYRSSKKIIFTK